MADYAMFSAAKRPPYTGATQYHMRRNCPTKTKMSNKIVDAGLAGDNAPGLPGQSHGSAGMRVPRRLSQHDALGMEPDPCRVQEADRAQAQVLVVRERRTAAVEYDYALAVLQE